ncbi:MAG: hypothetical protein A2Z69_00380 [Bacteroidetes bacterium RBG_13_44_24]|nr:MAG: hypothetical protein A2Z69_00380 [Bacteroidetes bacterium RBG_13_44_24]
MSSEMGSTKQLGSGSKFVDDLQEQLSLINESLLFCHQKLDRLVGGLPLSNQKKPEIPTTAFLQAVEFVVRVKESAQCLADRMKDI